MNKEYGDIKVEVWKYSPALLSEDEWADRLSLYLCMKDSKDERIQMECDTLIEEITAVPFRNHAVQIGPDRYT